MNLIKIQFFLLAGSFLWATSGLAQTPEVDMLPQEAILLLPLANETDDPNLASQLNTLLFENFGDRKPFVLHGQEWLAAQNIDPSIHADDTCQKSDCLDTLAQYLEVRGIIYGSIRASGELLVWEIKIFDADKGRIVAKVLAEGSSAEVLAPEGPGLLHELMEQLPPRPPKAPPIKKTLWESPLLVSGVALTAVSSMALVGALGYVIDAEMKLASPDIHRDLKAESLAYGRNGVWVAAGACVGIAGGLVLTGAGVLFYE